MEYFDFVVIYNDNESLEDSKNLVMQKIKDCKYEVNQIEEWGTKMLAYPIKNNKEGYFVCYNLTHISHQTVKDKFLKEINKLQEDNNILKFIMVKLEE